ncbi:MAG: hypothetical protein LBH82_04075 [Bacteroidales bacterium]|jgi:hypothetical protein|nr:hypothetical protein [Bacteroidales bacterium]
MKTYKIDNNCQTCFRAGNNSCCGVRLLFRQLRVPRQEQLVLMNLADEKQIDCESFKTILSYINNLK